MAVDENRLAKLQSSSASCQGLLISSQLAGREGFKMEKRKWLEAHGLPVYPQGPVGPLYPRGIESLMGEFQLTYRGRVRATPDLR